MDTTNYKRTIVAHSAAILVVIFFIACGSSSTGGAGGSSGGTNSSGGGSAGHLSADSGSGGTNNAGGRVSNGGIGGVVSSGGSGASAAGAGGSTGGQGGNQTTDSGGVASAGAGTAGISGSGGLDGNAGADAGTDAAVGSAGCPSALDDCNGQCVNLRSKDNCGACGNVCPDEMYCKSDPTFPSSTSACRCPNGYAQTDASGTPSGTGMTCTPWETMCRSYCPVNDAGFQICHPDYVCNAGFCDGLTICGQNYCTSITTDAANCGDCGIVCATGQFCVNGSCKDCAGSTSKCGRDCVNLTKDPANCGACGHVCPGSVPCLNGTCTCPAGTPDICSGTCVDLMGDPANCGACGKTCDTGHGFQCIAGVCKVQTSCVTVGGSCQSQYECCANANTLGTCGNLVGSFGKCCLYANVTCTKDSDCCCGTCSFQYGCCN